MKIILTRKQKHCSPQLLCKKGKKFNIKENKKRNLRSSSWKFNTRTSQNEINKED